MTIHRGPSWTPTDPIYPESDGKPMGEMPLHRDEMNDLIARLRVHLADQPEAYVSGNMLLYYEEGDPKQCFSPDVFVALGAGDRERRVYKLWDEPGPPTVVFEVSSKSTSIQDEGNKRVLCQRLGVAEYWLYDPEAEYLDPPLHGYRLAGGRYARILPGEGGRLRSDSLGLDLALEDGLVELYPLSEGRRLLRIGELWQKVRELGDLLAAQALKLAERDAALREERAELVQERAARRKAEAEIERLREELEAKGD